MLALCPGCGCWHETSTGYGFNVQHCRECWLGDSEERWRRSMRGANKYYNLRDDDRPKASRNQ